MSLDECMQKHSHRQYLMWMRYLEAQWNQPTRTDYYLMQIAGKIDGLFGKKGSKTTMEKLLMKFRKKKKATKSRPVSKEQIAASKSVWKAFVGIKD